jgi:hypothetical protein
MTKRILLLISFSVLAIFVFSANTFAQFCTEPGSIRRVRNTSIGSNEYVVFDVFMPPDPQYSTSAVSPPFSGGSSGEPVTVRGGRFRKIRFDSVVWTCRIQELLTLPRSAVKDVKNLEQFEGIVEYVVGYRKTARYITTYHYDVGSIRKVVMKFRK